MNKELIIRSGSNNIDFALLKDGKLIEFHSFRNLSMEAGNAKQELQPHLPIDSHAGTLKSHWFP